MQKWSQSLPESRLLIMTVKGCVEVKSVFLPLEFGLCFWLALASKMQKQQRACSKISPQKVFRACTWSLGTLPSCPRNSLEDMRPSGSKLSQLSCPRWIPKEVRELSWDRRSCLLDWPLSTDAWGRPEEPPRWAQPRLLTYAITGWLSAGCLKPLHFAMICDTAMVTDAQANLVPHPTESRAVNFFTFFPFAIFMLMKWVNIS